MLSILYHALNSSKSKHLKLTRELYQAEAAETFEFEKDVRQTQRRNHTPFYATTSFGAEGLKASRETGVEARANKFGTTGVCFSKLRFASEDISFVPRDPHAITVERARSLPTKFQRNFHSFRRGR